MSTNKTRGVAMALAAAVALSAVTFTPAEARVRRNDAAALAAFAGIVGTIAVLASRSRNRDHYYYGQPAYYYGQPAYAAPVYPAPGYGGPVHVAPRPGYGWHRYHRHRYR
jgi:hypothetical protein